MTRIGPEIEEIRIEPIELPDVVEDEPKPELEPVREDAPEPAPTLAPVSC